jgi:protein TonB
MEEQMFNNLIESSSHRREYRRRGSFFLFTTASYALFFVIAGIASIYAYDARMDDQNLELATIMPLIDLPPAEISPQPASEVQRTPSSNAQNLVIRRNPIATVDEPTLVPEKTSSAPNTNPPVPRGSDFVKGNVDANPVQPSSSGSSSGNGIGGNSTGPVVAIADPPPTPPAPKPPPKVVRKTILNGEALALPKPPYPPMAKLTHIEGTVNVQVLIDETGKVISATPVSGHPLLVHVAKNAAFQARFSPTFLGDQPVKVSGVITYNFVLQ